MVFAGSDANRCSDANANQSASQPNANIIANGYPDPDGHAFTGGSHRHPDVEPFTDRHPDTADANSDNSSGYPTVTLGSGENQG
jgi:hypothetical protein